MKRIARLARSCALCCLLVGAAALVAACGGSASVASSVAPEGTETDGNAPSVVSGSGTSASGGGGVTSPVVPPAETGGAKKIVPVPGKEPAVVAFFPDGRAFYSPDGYNLGGGGSTVEAYTGEFKVVDVVAVESGIDALFNDGSVIFSPDGKNLSGGGASLSAFRPDSGSGLQGATFPLSGKITGLTPVGTGLDVILETSQGASAVYFSPDGLNLGGGGQTIQVYGGQHGVVQQVAAVGSQDAVVTLFANGAAYYSPDNRSIGGGGRTISAAPNAHSAILRLVPVSGLLMTEFANGNVYLSPDGTNLAGGGRTVQIPGWNGSVADAPFEPRDSAHGAIFHDQLWLSGGFSAPTRAASCFTTCSFFDLWSSKDPRGTEWNATPSFATVSGPNPRDASPVVNGGVQDSELPTDFYDAYSPLIVWNEQLTAIGATVWRSSDGVVWSRQNQADGLTPMPGPTARAATENSRALILGSSIFYLSLDTGEVFLTNDPNASGWTALGVITGFTPRCGAAAFSLQGKMWVVGGGACDYSQVYNDVWSSEDGINWTQSATPAGWSARMWPCVASGQDGTVWMVGGYAPTDWRNSNGTLSVRYGSNHADVWYSKDGSSWLPFKADAGSGLPDDGKLEPRHASTCYVVGGASSAGELIIVAGTGGSDRNAANSRTLRSIRTLSLPATASLP